MNSVLTRRIFRQILRNEPLLPRHCPRAIGKNHFRQNGLVGRRTFFGWGDPMPKKEKKVRTTHPGMLIMTELGERMRLDLRPQPIMELRAALKGFLSSFERGTSLRLTDVQSENILATIQYLIITDPDGRSGLAIPDMKNCLFLLSPVDTKKSKINEKSNQRKLELAKLVYDEAQSLHAAAEPEGRSKSVDRDIMEGYLKVLGAAGEGMKALEVLQKHHTDSDGADAESLPWHYAILGSARKNDQEELEHILSVMKSHGVKFDSPTQEVMVDVLAAQDALEAVKLWYQRPLEAPKESREGKPTQRTNLTVARLCMKQGDAELAQKLVTDVVQEDRMDLQSWNVVLCWSLISGKGVSEVERLIRVMQRRSRGQRNPLDPEASTVVSLLQAALWQKDSYKAERILAMAMNMGVRLNASAWVMLVEHRLNHGDMPGAIEAYDKVKHRYYELADGEDTAVINRLITELCRKEGSDFEQIMSLVSELLERKIPFEPDTVSDLAILHMRREEIHDAADLLRTYSNDFDQAGRELIRDKLLHLCFSSSGDIALSWDAYVMVHELFGDTPRETRERIMAFFFKHHRPDMAVHVFGHMRQSRLPERRPSADSYRQCFEGMALTGALNGGQEEILETVHNMLKLDYEVDPDVRVDNALMMAEVAAFRQERALRIWDRICESEEGPTYESIRIALWACEWATARGDAVAEEIWARLEGMGVEITRELFVSYMWTHAASGRLDTVRAMILELEPKFGTGPDLTVIGVVHNIMPPDDRDDFGVWTRAHFPGLWEQLEACDKIWVGDELMIESYDVDRQIRT